MAHLTVVQKNIIKNAVDTELSMLNCYVKDAIKLTSDVSMSKGLSIPEMVDDVCHYIENNFLGTITYSLMTKGIMCTKEDIMNYRHTVLSICDEIEENQSPTQVYVNAISSTNNFTINATTKYEKFTVQVTGGQDPEGKPIKWSIECSNSTNIKSLGNGQYEITVNKDGFYLVIATAEDDMGLKSVGTLSQRIYGGSTSGGGSGQFTGTTFDSGWTDVVESCKITAYEFKLKVSQGHSNSTDVIAVLGKDNNGKIFVLSDGFNSSNSKEITENQILSKSGVYGVGNLSGTQWNLSKTISNSTIRQVRFICWTDSSHTSCVSEATISYDIDYVYDGTLDE